MHNSPIVCNRYISIIHATGVKFGDIDIPNTNTRNPKPTKRSAIPNLIGPAGSNPLLAKLIHNIEKKGASIKINIVNYINSCCRVIKTIVNMGQHISKCFVAKIGS